MISFPLSQIYFLSEFFQNKTASNEEYGKIAQNGSFALKNSASGRFAIFDLFYLIITLKYKMSNKNLKNSAITYIII